MVICKICQGNFKDSPDMLVMCSHHQGAVHMGCCVNNCSWIKEPCDNAHGSYEKL